MKHKRENVFFKKLDESEIEFRVISCQYPKSIPSIHIDQSSWKIVAGFASENDMRLVSLWAAIQGESDTEIYIYVVFVHSAHERVLIRTALTTDSPALPSISEHFVYAIRMERTITDMFGIRVENSVDNRRWTKHEHWPRKWHPLLLSFKRDSVASPMETGTYNFLKARGDGVHEIPVGPVHAGIIEPGHFRFLAMGEEILNLEERLGYVHKGIEKRIEGMGADNAIRIASRVSGDTTVGHGWAFAMACEEAAQIEVPERASVLRGILCERERMANHIGDIGAICNDAAFSFMHAHMQRLRENMASTHKKLFGHRLMMDLVVPGGVNFDIRPESILALDINTKSITCEVDELREIFINSASIQERVTGSGVIGTKLAESTGLMGYVGRASGLSYDVRVNNAYPPYDKIKANSIHKKHGDVASRVKVRFEEINESARLISQMLEQLHLPKGKNRVVWKAPSEPCAGFSAIEGWRGEIAYWISFNPNGTIQRCMIKDPSVVNWLGLELAVRGLPVPEFPLNNKSFNCSYSGNDL